MGHDICSDITCLAQRIDYYNNTVNTLQDNTVSQVYYRPQVKNMVNKQKIL
jgi:hypothetical protein